MIEVVTALLLVALSTYVLFGGADFGGGLLEASLRREEGLQRKLQGTMSPVWEANHVWLIAVVVILFVGFPKAYAELLTRFFFPIGLALLGIILRGTFFTFRKYDPNPGSWEPLYHFLFRVSSFLTPVCFGFVVAGMLSPHPLMKDGTFETLYIKPWFNGFGIVTGLFVSFYFAYLAAVFFWGEVKEDFEKVIVEKRIRLFFISAFWLGAFVLLLGAWSGRVDWKQSFTWLQKACQLVALASIFGMQFFIKRKQKWAVRLVVGVQTLAVLGGWFGTQLPVILKIGELPLTLQSAAAPPITLKWLVIGLVVVLSLVIPLLVLLYKVFDEGHQKASQG